MYRNISNASSKTEKNKNEDHDFWHKKGKSELEKAIELQINEKVAKVRTVLYNVVMSLTRLLVQNIILFIGDGMSLPTVTAARTYKSQQKVLWSFYSVTILFIHSE